MRFNIMFYLLSIKKLSAHAILLAWSQDVSHRPLYSLVPLPHFLMAHKFSNNFAV
jgi:hypothetical protein